MITQRPKSKILRSSGWQLKDQRTRSFVPQDDKHTRTFWVSFAMNFRIWPKGQDPSFLRMTDILCHSELLLRRILVLRFKGKILRSSGWQTTTVILSFFCYKSSYLDKRARSFVPQDDRHTLSFWASFAKNLSPWPKGQDPSFLRMTDNHCHAKLLLRRILVSRFKDKILRSSE